MTMSHLSRRRAVAALAGTLALASAPRVFAQGQAPRRAITWLVGQPPGGSTDVLTRLVAREVEQTLGQPVVVENRAGAAGAIALQAVARAAPDGLTLVTVPGPILYGAPAPQIGKELTGIAMLASGRMVLVGTAARPMPPTLEALLAAARKDPQAFSFATSGTGTGQHLGGELMNQIAQTQIVHVPYKGGSQAVVDVVGGEVPLAMLGITPVLPHIKAGRLRAYGVSTAARSPALPDVPTLHEAGLPGFDAAQWFVAAAPAGLPADRAKALNAAIAQALRKPEVQAGLANVGLEPGAAASPAESTAFVTGEVRRWRELARKAKLSLD